MKPCLSMDCGRLRPAAADDLDDLVRLLHDAQVRRYLCDDTVLPRETVAGLLTRSATLDPRGLGLWAIETADARFAGIAGLQPVAPETGTAPGMVRGIEPIIALAPAQWARGLAGAALDALVRHADLSLGLARLVAAVDRPNARSHRLMRRCGFTAIRQMPGPAHDLVLYELTLGTGTAQKG